MSKIKDFIDSVEPVNFFIYTAALFGIIFILITPPFQTPDEPVHFFRSYQLSTLNLVVDVNGRMAGGYLPKAVGDSITNTATKPVIKFLPNKKYDIYKTKEAFSLKVNEQDKEFYDFSSTALYSPISYIPQVAGISVGKLFNAPPILMVYLAKLMNLAAWIIMGALAIRLIPRRKWAIAFLALLPMSIFQAGSLSTDVMASGVALLLLAYIMRLRDSKTQLNLKQLGLLLALASVMVLTKQIMFVLLPLVFLLPSRLFPSRSLSYLLKIMLIVIPMVFWLGWLLITKATNLEATYTNGQVPPEQLEFILFNPHSYINVLWNTYFFTWGDTMTRSFIGSFGWVDAPLSEGIVVIGYIGLLAILIINTSGSKIKKWVSGSEKLYLSSIALLYLLATSTALYVYYSPVGYKIIVGLQGRYLLPFAILLVPVFYSGWLKASRSVYRYIAILVPIFLLVCSAITIYVRYYVNNV